MANCQFADFTKEECNSHYYQIFFTEIWKIVVNYLFFEY